MVIAEKVQFSPVFLRERNMLSSGEISTKKRAAMSI